MSSRVSSYGEAGAEPVGPVLGSILGVKRYVKIVGRNVEAALGGIVVVFGNGGCFRPRREPG